MEEEREMPLVDIMAVLYRFRKLILIFTLIGIVLSAVYVFITKKRNAVTEATGKYTAEVTLRVNNNIAGNRAIQLLKSVELYDFLAKEFDFSQIPEIDSSNKSKLRTSISKIIKTSYTNNSDTFLVDVTLSSQEMSKQVANCIADWLLQKEEKSATTRMNTQKDIIEKKIKQICDDLVNSESELLEYERQHKNQNYETLYEYKKLTEDISVKWSIYSDLKKEYDSLVLKETNDEFDIELESYAADTEFIESKKASSKLHMIITPMFLFLGIFLAFLLDAIRNLKNDEEAMKRLKGEN